MKEYCQYDTNYAMSSEFGLAQMDPSQLRVMTKFVV